MKNTHKIDICRPLLFAFFAIFFFGISGVNPAYANQWHEDSIISETDGKTSLQPFLLSDSKGMLHLIYQDQADSIFSIKYRKFDGEQWGEIKRLTSESRYARRPSATIDKDDNIHIIFLMNKKAVSDDSDYKAFYMKIDSARGDMMIEPTLILEDRYLPQPWAQYKKDMVVDDLGMIHVIGDRYFRFNEQGKILELNPDISGNTITKDNNGNVYVIKTEDRKDIENNVFNSFIIIQKWDGNSWTSKELFENTSKSVGFAGGIDIENDENGNLYLVYIGQFPERGLYLRKYDGKNWGSRETVFVVDSHSYEIKRPKVGISRKDKDIHIVYEIIDFKNNFGHDPGCVLTSGIQLGCDFYRTLFHSKYDKSQGTWKERVRVDDKGFGETLSHTIAIDMRDDLHLAWSDGELIKGVSWILEIYYDHYTDSLIEAINHPPEAISPIETIPPRILPMPDVVGTLMAEDGTSISMEETGITPEKAIAIINEKLEINNSDTKITIIEKENEDETKKPDLIYEASSKKEVKIFGIFKIQMDIISRVDASTGEVINIDKPWWAWLAF